MNNEEDFPHLSLCRIVGRNKKRNAAVLSRLMDVEGDRICEHLNPGIVGYTLYDEQYTGAVGVFGICGWREAFKAGGRFDVTAKFLSEKLPIMIILVPSCKSDEDLKLKLSKGAAITFLSGKVLLAYATEHDTYRGVICVEKNITRLGTTVGIRVDTLNLFEVRTQDCIKVAGKIFCKKFKLESVGTVSSVTNSDQTFRTKPAELDAKSKEGTVAQLKRENEIKALEARLAVLRHDCADREEKLEAAEARLDEVQRECSSRENRLHATEARLVEVQRNYSERVNELNALEARLVKLLRTRAGCENEIKELEARLAVLRHDCADREEKLAATEFRHAILQRECDAREIKLNATEARLTALQRECETRASMINATEARLDELQRESSELKRKLGADQAKHDRLFKSISKHEPIAIAVRRKAALQMNKCFRAGRAIESETLIEHEDVRDFVESLNEMLDNKLFAVCLWTAYMDRIPLLLAGPCAHEIADAFSLALTGKTAAVFDCAGVNTLEDLNICLFGDDEIVALLNPLASNMISYLPELVSSGGKYFFALQPFVEDLKLEPRGLYNYFLPVRTECMLERRPALNFDEKFSSAALVEEMRAKYSPEKIPIAADARLKRLVRDMGKIVAPDQAFADELRSFLEADDE